MKSYSIMPPPTELEDAGCCAIMPPAPEPDPPDDQTMYTVYEVLSTLFKSMRMLRNEADLVLNRHNITIAQLCVHLYLHESKVKAIKTWKDYCGVGLKEAKESVEALVASATVKTQEA